MKKAGYVLFLLLFLGLEIGIGQISSYVQQLADQQKTQQDAANTRLSAMTVNLAHCMDTADTLWQNSLDPKQNPNLGKLGSDHYQYLEAVTQLRLAQVTECEAQYPVS